MTAASLLAAARRHTDEVIVPNVRAWERQDSFPREAARMAAASGLLGLFATSEAGGQDQTFAEGMGVFEELGRGDASYAFALSMHNAVANVISRFGSEGLRDRFARALTSGELLGCFSLTEPHAGSDAAAITTRAVPDGDGWRVTGRKGWVSLIGEAGVYLVACRTGEDRGTGDVMLVAIDAKAAGVQVESVYDKAAASFLPIGTLALQDVPVPADAVVAPAGQGMQAALGAIDVARCDIAAIAIGIAAASLDVTLAYARDRAAFGGTLLDLQALQFALADVETEIVAGRLLYERAAAGLTAGSGAVDAAHAKSFCPAAALRATIACSQALGANGWLNDFPIARHLANAKMLQVVDGTTEIQRLVIARSLRRRAAAL